VKLPILVRSTSLPARLPLRFPRITLIFKKTGLGGRLCWRSTSKLETSGSQRPDDHYPAKESWLNCNGNEFGRVSLKDELPG